MDGCGSVTCRPRGSPAFNAWQLAQLIPVPRVCRAWLKLILKDRAHSLVQFGLPG